MIRIASFVALLLTAGLGPNSSFADIRQDGIECLKAWDRRDIESTIASCTRVIDSRQFTGEVLGTAYWLRAQAYRARGDIDRALADLNRSISLKPGDFSSYINRGILYSLKQNYERALADFAEAIRINPDHPFPYYNRGYVRYLTNDCDHAVEDFLRAISLQNDYALAHYYLARCYGRQRRYAEAIQSYSDAIRHNIGYTDAYFSRGLLQEGMNDIPGAIESYRGALSRPPNGPLGPEAQARARERLASLERK